MLIKNNHTIIRFSAYTQNETCPVNNAAIWNFPTEKKLICGSELDIQTVIPQRQKNTPNHHMIGF